jgi:hypothetical protein
MRAPVRLAWICLLCLAVAACGGSSSDSASSNRQAIMHIITSIESDLATGDYSGACQLFSQRQQTNIVSGAKKAGLNASTCAGAFSTLVTTAGVSKAQLAQAFGGPAPKIHSLVIRGNQATITYTDTVNGKSYTETDALVREGGAWKADRTISRRRNG